MHLSAIYIKCFRLFCHKTL